MFIELGERYIVETSSYIKVNLNVLVGQLEEFRFLSLSWLHFLPPQNLERTRLNFKIRLLYYSEESVY